MIVFAKRFACLSALLAVVLLFAPIAPGVLKAQQAVAEDRAAEQALDTFLARLRGKRKGQVNSVATNANGGRGTVAGGGKSTTQTEIVLDRNVEPMLAVAGADALRSAAERYRRIITEGGFPKVSRSSLKKGSTGKNVVALNQRLYLEGYVRPEAAQGEFAQIYTSATEDGVRRFQQNLGLAVTGNLDGPTIEALNVPAQRRLAAIEANIPRLEAYAESLGDRYVVVNVPAQQIEAVANGRVFSRHNAVVGRPERPSPVVMAAVSDINFNPYWNAPVSIVEKDIIPKLRGGPGVLRDMNMKVFDGVGGPEVDPGRINWRRVVPDNYHFRQEPGPGNAMATAKVNFPSPFGIYLHDTPEKQYFDINNRFISSGCIRVQQMPLLVNWILNGQDGIGEAEIATLAETLERRDVKLLTPPQLRVVYLTAWPATGGTVAFRGDIYNLDGSGFIVGQPMPVGELSPEGQRFVLKPLPRLVAEVDDTFGGGGFFSFGKRKSKNDPGRKFSLFGSDQDEDGKRVSSGSATLKKDSEAKKKLTASTAAKSKATGKKSSAGLFDWSSWRKEQIAATKKKAIKKVAKKKVKAADSKVASAEATDGAVAKKKVKATGNKVAATEATDGATSKKKAPATATAKAKILIASPTRMANCQTVARQRRWKRKSQ